MEIFLATFIFAAIYLSVCLLVSFEAFVVMGVVNFTMWLLGLNWALSFRCSFWVCSAVTFVSVMFPEWKKMWKKRLDK